jgi:hypothetical protein
MLNAVREGMLAPLNKVVFYQLHPSCRAGIFRPYLPANEFRLRDVCTGFLRFILLNRSFIGYPGCVSRMKLVACCLCLCLVLAGVVAVASGTPVQATPSFWESIAQYTGWLFPHPAPTGIPDATLNTFGLSYQCMVPGTYNRPSIYLQNTGNMTWNETNQIRLGAVGESGGDAAKFGPLRVPIESGKDVLPGQTYEFQVPFTAPQARGNYSLSYRMIREGHNSFGDTVTIPIQVTYPCPYPELSDVWSGWYVPTAPPVVMTAGQTQEASIRVINTGTTIWNESGKVRLGAVGDSSGDASKFGVGRVLIPAGVDVRGIVNNQAVEDHYLFKFRITAPQTPGTYKPAFRMVQDGNQWFGPVLTVPIEVKAPPGPVPPYNSTIVSWTVPEIQNGKAAPGRQIDTTIHIMNTGSETWFSTYYNPTPYWSNGDVGLSNDISKIDPNMSRSEYVMFSWMKNGFPGRDCYTGDTCQFWFRFIAPTSPGTYDMHFRMARLLNGTTTWGFGENLTIPLQVVNASSVSIVPAGLNQTLLEPGLNFQVSGGGQVGRTLPSGIASLQPVSEHGEPAPSATPREVHAPLKPAGTDHVLLPVVTGTTPAATPPPEPVAARTLRTDAGLIRHLPVASFTITPSEGTTPLSVTCDASASAAGQGSIISSAWNFGDGTTAGGKAVTHVYTLAGNYTITLVVTDSASQSATTLRVVNVSAPAAAVRINPERPPVRMLQPIK